jgi:hypothetical protein
MENLGDTAFATPVYVSVGDDPTFLAIADLDGDCLGRLDIAVANRGSDDVSILLNCTGCDCPHQGDYDDDTFITSLDLGSLADILYAGQPDVQDCGCPSPRGDLDCDGYTTSLDLGIMVDHLYSGGPGPCDPCNP